MRRILLAAATGALLAVSATSQPASAAQITFKPTANSQNTDLLRWQLRRLRCLRYLRIYKRTRNPRWHLRYRVCMLRRF
jgi:hypothetical protein